MKLHRFLKVSLLFSVLYAYSQEQKIDTVYLFDIQLDHSQRFQHITKIVQEDLLRNSTNLSEALRFQSPVYIKENGRGMVSSPSFRGTSAQQTAFIWNGINVNSVTLGQGDINNLGMLIYDGVALRAGGSSVIYGSSAIGGTVHLNNDLGFNKGLNGSLFAEYGSFETRNTVFKTSYSDEKFSVKAGFALSSSENDYEVPEKKYLNRNGQYDNRSFSLGAGYRLNPEHTFLWQTVFFDGDQHYPTSEFGTPTKYLSDTFRTVVDWRYRSDKIRNSLKTAYLEDTYSYFEDTDFPKSSGATTKSYLASTDFNWLAGKDWSLNLLATYRLDEAEGYQSGIQQVQRNSGSAAALARWNINPRLHVEAGLKKEWLENYEAPFLYSFAGQVQIADFYDVTLNASKNFRAPSFNDLYWQPGGNPAIRPEFSNQADLSNRFRFKGFEINITPFYLYIKDMIRWLPTAEGYWSPFNTDKVESYGVESSVQYKHSFSKSSLQLQGGYSYTHSADAETGRLLMYVPEHKAFGSAAFLYSGFELFGQALFTSRVFVTSDENTTTALPYYTVVNGRLSYNFLQHYSLGLKVNNIFDTVYQTVESFPMPKRNYSVHVRINF